jgi:hypothetical protein
MKKCEIVPRQVTTKFAVTREVETESESSPELKPIVGNSIDNCYVSRNSVLRI